MRVLKHQGELRTSVAIKNHVTLHPMCRSALHTCSFFLQKQPSLSVLLFFCYQEEKKHIFLFKYRSTWNRNNRTNTPEHTTSHT